MRLMISGQSAAMALIATGLLTANAAQAADVTSGSLYFTTYAAMPDGKNVGKLDFNFDGTQLTVSGQTSLVVTNGADGIIYAPNGNLLVAGQSQNNITEMAPSGSIVRTNGLGSTGTATGNSYHLAVSPTNDRVYSVGNGGCASTCVSANPINVTGGLNAGGIGTTYTVSNTKSGASLDVRGLIYSPFSGKWYYTTAPDGSAAAPGKGDFGTAVINDTTHTVTLTPILTGAAQISAHGLSYDPFSKNIIINGSGSLYQFNTTTNTIASTFSVSATGTLSSTAFDQAAADGQGHLFVASNDGSMWFIDYQSSNLIGASGNYVTQKFVANYLDDISPVINMNPIQVPEPAPLAVLGLGLLGLSLARHRRQA